LTATLARNEEERDQALNELQSMTIESMRQGLSVQLSGSVDYQNIAVFAAIADVTQVNIGDAIFSRALSVGWNVAVKEMKAMAVRAGLMQRA
jgi:pyridoxine 5-phosphate synthase